MRAVSEILLAPDVRPFAVAAAIMAALGAIELLTTLVGFSISGFGADDVAVETDSHDALGGLFLWINAGRLPLLILIILALGVFSIEGFALQGVAHGLGITVPAWIAGFVAFAAMIPVIRTQSRGISRIIPRDELYRPFPPRRPHRTPTTIRQGLKMWEFAVPVAIGVIAILVIGLIFARLYRRSTRDEAYVRTGLGGQKVVLDGGSLVLPIFHSTAAVNLKTLRLEVARGGPDSLITKDRMRVDIGAEFYLRVKPDSSSIALAAQTLGNRTNDATELRELVEAKFVDGLRSVAATMNLEELQEQRATFVKAVQDAVGADIQNNGLELESVSLTRLDQSDIKHFNPNNFFDAHGLTTLTKITKEREQERNQIVRSTEVNIAQQDLVARQTTLTIESTKREAEL